jgi:CRISPR-associated exonuclease Cas4
MSVIFVVSDLKQWAYCRRLVYYFYIMPGLRPETFKMEAGAEAHEREHRRARRRSLRAFGLKEAERIEEVRLESETLGLSGKVDLVLRQDDQVWPVEYKLSRKLKTASHYRLQLTAYGLLLEEAWGVHAPEGFLYSLVNRKTERVALNSRLRKQVLTAVAEMRATLEEERMPPPTTQRGRCVDCEFRRFCNDVW